MISAAQLRQIMPTCPQATINVYAVPIYDAMVAFGIDQTLERQAMFIAQVAHETIELRYVVEIASGAAYEGRLDLGNTQPGDGVKFKGRGLLQITGRLNYASCSLALFGDYRLLSAPQLLEQAAHGADAAGWFWQSNGINLIADAGDFVSVSRRINGTNKITGEPNGLAQRLMYWRRAQLALGEP
jgi:putative chitinase